jgi:proton glutamate symport protein
LSLANRVLLGLVVGFLLGLALTSSAAASPILAFVSPFGTIFINLIRMTVTPLVVSMLVASVGSIGASGSSGSMGRMGARAAIVAVAMLAVAAVGSLAVAQPVLARVSIDQAAALALRGAGGPLPAGAASPGVAQWLIDLVPQNVFKAAADGVMLPVIVFSVLFGLALGRVAETRRAAVLDVVHGIAGAMQRLVAGILELAPIGVFALAVPLASRLGLAAAAAVVAYVVLVVALTVLAAVLILYPVGILGGRMPVSAFVGLCAPAQAVAFASRSSLASLPAMVESAERAAMPEVVSALVLPIAASVFRAGAAVAQTVGVLFLARLYGVPLSGSQLATIVFTVVLTTFAVPGVPGGSVIAMVPVLASANLPIDGIGILLAVDTIPDMFRTTANVTGSLSLAAVLARGTPRASLP